MRGFLVVVASLCCGAQALGLWTFSSCGLRALERRLSSCGARALLLRGMWDLPGPGQKPVSPALAGGFSTTAPPGKHHSASFLRVTTQLICLQSPCLHPPSYAGAALRSVNRSESSYHSSKVIGSISPFRLRTLKSGSLA